MVKVRFICLIVAAWILVAAGSNASPQASTSPASLSLEDVIKLTQDGFSEEVIVAKIKKNNKPFDLNREELVELKKTGINDTIIRLLIDPSQPYSPPAPPPPAAPPVASPSPPAVPPKPNLPAKVYPEDSHASKAPPDPGLYRFIGDTPQSIDVKILLSVKESPGLGKVLFKKGRTIGYLVGPGAKARTQNPTPVFYLRLPEGKGMEEVVLVAFEKKNSRREIEMGPAPKPELQADSMRPFDYIEVGPRLFRLTPAKLAKGEYVFFLIGTAEPPKGSLGKGYDIGVDEPANRK